MADQFKPKKSDEITTLAKQLKQPESKTILDEMTSLSENPEYARTAPPETKQELQAAIQQAREMYNQRTTNNDWMEVAQTLSRAVAQFGAAQAGARSGRDMSNLNMGPTIDYGARSDRAARDYGQMSTEARDMADRTRQEWADNETTKKASYGQAYEPLKERLRNAQQIEGDESRFNREAALQKSRDKKENDRIDNTNKRLEYGDLDKQEVSLRGQLLKAEQAADTAINRIINDEASSKDAKKYAAQNPELLAKAGIDADVWADIVEKSKDKGVLGTGFFRGENKDTKAQLAKQASKNYLDGIKAQIDAIRNRKQQLLNKSDTALQEPQTSVQSNTSGASPQEASDKQPEKPSNAPPASRTGMARIRYRGQTLDIPQSELKAALADGAELVK